MDDLVDRIYEAAAIPELWLPILDRMTGIVGGAGASFVTGGPDGMRWVATPAMDALIRDYGTQLVPNPRITDVMIRRHPGWVVDQEMFAADFIETDPFYTDFMRPRGYGWCIGTAIFPPSADPLIFAVEKRYSDGPVEPRHIATLDALRPHMARAATMSAQLALERARATADALGRIGLPAALLNTRLKIKAANRLFQSYMPHVVADRAARIRLTSPAADALLADALARLNAAADGGARSIPLRGGESRPPMVLHLLPVRRAAHDVFTDAAMIVVLTPVVPGSAPAAQLLEGLFDLTPAEARVARAIAGGSTPEEAAAAARVSRSTIRVQLRAVFAKTGTRRQADLVHLLHGLTLPISSSSDDAVATDRII